MKEKLTFIKKKIERGDVGNDAFFPAWNHAFKTFKKVKYDREYLTGIEHTNNTKFHRLMFAIVRCVKANLPEDHFLRWNNERQLLAVLQLEIGDTEKCIDMHGNVIHVPSSIAFANKSDDEKQPLFEKLCEVAAKLLKVEKREFENNYKDYR
jgi:hypothetical protein